MSDVRVNREYKDRLFRFRFGTQAYKADMLSLYNALNGTAYGNAEELSITTIEDVIYVGMKNDVSILLDGNLSLWEQQSTLNPNMPIRGLMYFGNLYSQYIKANKLNIYGTKLQKIPTPRYVVFYNGTDNSKAVTELRLSDAFIHESGGGFEWTAVVYNLNRGKNDVLLGQCKPLADYMELINRIRDNQRDGMDIKSAVDAAVDSCIADGIMAEFLNKHKAEVTSMCLTEFDEKVFVEGMKEEGREEGKIQATAENIFELLEDYGEIPERLRKLIMEQDDLELLRKWHKIAARVESMETFEEKIGMHLES
ncbi:hypothetical protein FMM75_18650 [Lachnospiraceae bacterium MD335]|nr:hypothetical protein [Lachnospiraceae bacterium MD335]